eukprot:13318258-Alexandrium_andersonii.AAC.1
MRLSAEGRPPTIHGRATYSTPTSCSPNTECADACNHGQNWRRHDPQCLPSVGLHDCSTLQHAGHGSHRAVSTMDDVDHALL